MSKKEFEHLAKKYSACFFRLNITSYSGHPGTESKDYIFDLEKQTITATYTMAETTKKLKESGLYPDEYWNKWIEKYCKTIVVHRKYVREIHKSWNS